MTSRTVVETKLEALKCWSQVLELLSIGEAFYNVAEFIQSQGEMKDIKTETLDKYLRKYVENNKDYVKNYLPARLPIYERAMIDYNLFNGHKLLAALQFERVMRAVEIEQKTGEVSAATTKQVDLLNTILSDLQKFEIERGTKRIKTQGISTDENGNILLTQKIKEQYISHWGNKTINIMKDPDSRRRVLNVLERFRAGSSGVVAQILKEQESEVLDGSNNSKP